MITDEYKYTATRAISFMFYLDKNKSADEVANKYIPILEKAFPEFSEFEYVKQSDWMVVIYPKDQIVERRAEYEWRWEEDVPIIERLVIYDDEAESIETRFEQVIQSYTPDYETEMDYNDNVNDVIDNIKSYITTHYCY